MNRDVPGRWLVLRTKSRQEKKAERDLQERQITNYLPRYVVTRRYKSRTRVVERPLFPGYCFVQPTPVDFDKLRYIRGSCGLIFFDGAPAKVNERDLETVQLMLESGSELDINTQLVPGRTVEVVAGSFMGARGELVRIKGKNRLVVNLEMINSGVSVEVDPEEVRIVESEAAL